MKQKNTCPLCESNRLTNLYEVDVPLLQNRVYESRDAAIGSGKGNMVLTRCGDCGFAFNAAFDENAIVYDENYDNSVPSKLFQDYYEQIVDYFYEKYRLKNEYVYDIGCGKGTFLKLLCKKYTDVNGIGIDPSYEGDTQPSANLRFINDFFKTEHVTEKPALLISRHVFEHIEYPVSFLNIIQEPLKRFQDIPVFIEVPDFEWIVKNETFWDICYEHCNYFSPYPLQQLFTAAAIRLNAITPAFGLQYLWVEGVINPSQKSQNNLEGLPFLQVNRVEQFIKNIELAKSHVKEVLAMYKTNSVKIAIWGMATKGVIFSNRIDPRREIIDYCIDINETKQNKYIPGTGHQIHAPSILENLHEKVVVIIMNGNYIKEIKQEALNYCRNCTFIDAHGNSI
ncbi:MAG TPA: class I SAM-dependent methyltransferase [Flavitalea sp.]|nr:class I SAM-dependent methyltransferase [Flavitalea sp.]